MEYLASDTPLHSSCLVLDVAMPVMSGPGLFRELCRRNLSIPVVFITARKDEVLGTRLLNDGATECLFKTLQRYSSVAGIAQGRWRQINILTLVADGYDERNKRVLL